jgi:hypothetical protein
VKTPAAAPYLLPPDSTVSAQPWTNEDGAEIGERLDHWDPYTDLNLVRVMEIDVDSIRAACLLGDDAAFAVTATWTSTTTRIAGHGPVVELGTSGGLLRTALDVAVPGTKVGGRLDLHTRLVLRYPGREPSPISPRRVGATLWTEQDRVALEGGAARFPIALADFSSTPRYPDGAAWVLEWDSDDLDAPVLGGMRLLVNRSNEALLETLKTGSSDARATAVRSFVIFDAARTLVSGALLNERFVENPEDFLDGSVGRMLFELLTLCWPGVPAAALKARSLEDPARFSAELQAHFGLIA